jgi:predicted DNA binding CopG/RHH family protein
MSKERKLEEEILASFEKGEWKPAPKQKSEIARFAAIASASLAKNKRVNIRISSRDLDDIQAKAAEEAIPYQTLMASVLHKYVTGRLVEPKTGLTTRSSGRGKKRRAA